MTGLLREVIDYDSIVQSFIKEKPLILAIVIKGWIVLYGRW
jgi:hypothetical protein